MNFFLKIINLILKTDFILSLKKLFLILYENLKKIILHFFKIFSSSKIIFLQQNLNFSHQTQPRFNKSSHSPSKLQLLLIWSTPLTVNKSRTREQKKNRIWECVARVNKLNTQLSFTIFKHTALIFWFEESGNDSHSYGSENYCY